METVHINVFPRGFSIEQSAVSHSLNSRGNGVKGHVALNKNLAFLKFSLYEVPHILFSFLTTGFLSGR